MRLQLIVVISILMLAPLDVVALGPSNRFNALKKVFQVGSSSGTRSSSGPRSHPEFPSDWGKFDPVRPTLGDATSAFETYTTPPTYGGLEEQLKNDGQWFQTLVRSGLSPWKILIDGQGEAEGSITKLRKKGPITPAKLFSEAEKLGQSYLKRRDNMPPAKRSLFAAKSRRLHDIDLALQRGWGMLMHAIARPEEIQPMQDLHKTLALTASRLQELRDDLEVLTPIFRSGYEPPPGFEDFIEERRQDITRLTKAHKDLLKLAHQESVKNHYQHLELDYLPHWGPVENHQA